MRGQRGEMGVRAVPTGPRNGRCALNTELLRELFDSNAQTRALAADCAADWPSEYDDDELDVLTRLLVWLATVETADEPRESHYDYLVSLRNRRRA